MAKTGATKKRGAVERKPRKSKASSTAKVPKRAKVDVQKLSCCKYLAAVVLIAANLVISGFGVSLSVLATKIILSGFSFGAWYIVALGISSALVLFGLYGASAANQYRGGPPREAKAKTRTRPRQERDTISTGGATESFYRNEVDSAAAPVDRGAGRLEHYFVLLVGLFVVQVWVAVYFAFDSGSVVKSLKASLHGQWSEFYQQLPSATVVALPDCNAVWSAYCWTEFVAYVENDWYQAQAVAFSLLLLFPLCMLLAGEALGCGHAMKMVDDAMAYAMVVMALLLCSVGMYGIIDVGGALIVPAAGALGIGVAMAVLATLTVYELHSRKPVCCKTRTLQRWLVIGYFVFSIVTSGLAIWTLTAEATLVAELEVVCDQACLDAIIQTLPPPALPVGAVDLRSANGSNAAVFEPPPAKESKGGTGRKDSGNSTQAADDAAAKAEFEADYEGRIDDLGWFMLLVALFLLLQTTINCCRWKFGGKGNEERRKDKGFTGVSRDSASIARESGSMQGV